MSAAQPIPRIALSWLLVAQALVILPHLAHLPAWIILLWLACAAWRIQIFRMRLGYPSGLAKGGLMLLAGGAVYASRGGLVGLDAGVVLLIAAFILKLVEMRSRRDALILIFLGFFVVLTRYLFEDNVLSALYSLLPVTALLAALIGLQQSGLAQRPWPTLRLAATLLLQAVPLMLLLFVLFPRLAPLWSLPMPNDKGVTGLADSMSPADVAELSRSSALAFRVNFEGAVPPRQQLYWRALTLERFDGRRWSQGPEADPPPRWIKHGTPLNYSVVMQPSSRPWLFGLDVAQTDLERTRQMGDFRLQRWAPVSRTLLYEVTSWPQAIREPQASPARLQAALALPAQGDPRTRAWALQLQRAHPTAPALVAALLTHFRQQPYVYTLRPPVLGADSIDQFLFDSQRGFCAHYAGAMTYVLRAAGIPARVVAGYQGGEQTGRGSLQVRQFDAHAWVEYWQPERGWVSVDPTFAVAPERIEQGLLESVSEEQDFLEDSPFSPLRYRQLGWLNQLRLSWDGVNDGWQRWVLSYQSQQQGLFQRWFGKGQAYLPALWLGGGVALLLGLLALLLFKPWRRTLDPEQRVYARFERILNRHGVRRGPGEGPQAYALRAAAQLPAQAASIQTFAALYLARRYAGQGGSMGELHRALRQVRRALPWRLSQPGERHE